MKDYADTLALVGRILLGLIFVLSGFEKLTDFPGTAGYIASKGLPMAQVLAALSVAIELGGGILLAVGWKARWAALVLFLFTIPITLVFHNFWAMTGADVEMNKIHFLKNVSIMGGMLLAAAFGPGRFSVDKG